MRPPVILPLHDSLFAPRVISLVAELGRRSDISIHVLDLSGEPRSTREESAPPARPGQVGETRARRTLAVRESVRESIARQLSDVLGSTRIRSASRAGDVADALGAYVQEQRAELVVLGVENRDTAGEQAALRFAKALVVDTGSSVFFTAAQRDRIRGTFLAQLDGSEAARARLELALSAARVAGVEELTVQAVEGRGGPTARAPTPAGGSLAPLP
jgi:hypothetical protein